MNYIKAMHPTAISATLHCLSGCAVGEILGLLIGTALGLSTLVTLGLAVTLAFTFGYLFSLQALIKSGMTLKAAISVALAADTLSILTMEIVDNSVMYMVPGAMEAGLTHPLFWIAMTIALGAAFCAALPVNDYLIKRGKGHALAHAHHAHEGHH